MRYLIFQSLFTVFVSYFIRVRCGQATLKKDTKGKSVAEENFLCLCDCNPCNFQDTGKTTPNGKYKIYAPDYLTKAHEHHELLMKKNRAQYNQQIEHKFPYLNWNEPGFKEYTNFANASSKDFYIKQKMPTVGFENHGNDCYFISAIQIIMRIPKIRAFFLDFSTTPIQNFKEEKLSNNPDNAVNNHRFNRIQKTANYIYDNTGAINKLLAEAKGDLVFRDYLTGLKRLLLKMNPTYISPLIVRGFCSLYRLMFAAYRSVDVTIGHRSDFEWFKLMYFYSRRVGFDELYFSQLDAIETVNFILEDADRVFNPKNYDILSGRLGLFSQMTCFVVHSFVFVDGHVENGGSNFNDEIQFVQILEPDYFIEKFTDAPDITEMFMFQSASYMEVKDPKNCHNSMRLAVPQDVALLINRMIFLNFPDICVISLARHVLPLIKAKFPSTLQINTFSGTVKYKLFAVICFTGQDRSGHYFVKILDDQRKTEPQEWFEANDSKVRYLGNIDPSTFQNSRNLLYLKV